MIPQKSEDFTWWASYQDQSKKYDECFDRPEDAIEWFVFLLKDKVQNLTPKTKYSVYSDLITDLIEEIEAESLVLWDKGQGKYSDPYGATYEVNMVLKCSDCSKLEHWPEPC